MRIIRAGDVEVLGRSARAERLVQWSCSVPSNASREISAAAGLSLVLVANGECPYVDVYFNYSKFLGFRNELSGCDRHITYSYGFLIDCLPDRVAISMPISKEGSVLLHDSTADEDNDSDLYLCRLSVTENGFVLRLACELMAAGLAETSAELSKESKAYLLSDALVKMALEKGQ